MKLRHIAAAAILAVAGSANAIPTTTVNWGPHGSVKFGFDSGVPDTDFKTNYTFTITAPGTLTSVLSAFNFTGGYSLFSGVPAGGMLKGGSYAPFTINSINLLPGSYYYKVIGGVNEESTSSGNYTLFSSFAPTAPVPEPETYALMLAGLGMVGFMASRRKQS